MMKVYEVHYINFADGKTIEFPSLDVPRFYTVKEAVEFAEKHENWSSYSVIVLWV
jgi:hypothetical protein